MNDTPTAAETNQRDDETVEFPAAKFAERFFAPHAPGCHLQFGAQTDTGKVRSNNEDHYVVVRRRRKHELLLTNMPPGEIDLADDSSYGMVVADGMGGANFGEFASRLAVQRVFELSQQATSWVMKFTDPDVQQIRQRVDAYVRQVQSTLREYITANPPLAGMGTTWTSAHLFPPHAVVVHIGDSRAYLMHRGELMQVTRDDTVSQAYLDAGVQPDLAKKFRHMLLNSLGGDRDDVTSQIYLLRIGLGDKLLLCTDGLTDMVSHRQITNILDRAPHAQAACDQLIAAALENGGKDNVTAVAAFAVDQPLA